MAIAAPDPIECVQILDWRIAEFGLADGHNAVLSEVCDHF
jgi:hypothetical protein